MNKKILISLSVIAVVAALAIGSTTAYFSDTETSTANTFTAGSVDLKVDNTCYFNKDSDGSPNCPWTTSTWALTDLQDGVHKFFNFTDIKPGDWGENTITLHVYDNDAWGWLKTYNVGNKENGCTEPEEKDDSSCGDPGVGEGELYENLHFLIWMDNNGNNRYETGEKILYDGCNMPLCEVWSLDGDSSSVPIDPLIGSQNYHVGIKWCFGNFDSNYNCDGTSIGNEAQGDSVSLDVSFVVVQSKNNLSVQGGPTCP